MKSLATDHVASRSQSPVLNPSDLLTVVFCFIFSILSIVLYEIISIKNDTVVSVFLLLTYRVDLEFIKFLKPGDLKDPWDLKEPSG